MIKKIVLGGLLVGLIGFLVAGAVIRTNAVAGSGEAAGRHTATVAEAGGNGQGGRGAAQGAVELQSNDGAATIVRGGDGNGGGGNGNGGGRGGNGGNGGETTGALGEPLADVQPTDWTSYAGTIVSAATDLVEVKTTTGEIIPFEGRPLSYALEQGFVLTVGDAVMLHGFAEDGEFKLGQVDNLATGASVLLRDASGRPGWAGRGRT